MNRAAGRPARGGPGGIHFGSHENSRAQVVTAFESGRSRGRSVVMLTQVLVVQRKMIMCQSTLVARFAVLLVGAHLAVASSGKAAPPAGEHPRPAASVARSAAPTLRNHVTL